MRPAPEVSVEDIKLPYRVVQALRNAGFRTVADLEALRADLPDAAFLNELLAIKNIGMIAAEQILAALAGTPLPLSDPQRGLVSKTQLARLTQMTPNQLSYFVRVGKIPKPTEVPYYVYTAEAAAQIVEWAERRRKSIKQASQVTPGDCA